MNNALSMHADPVCNMPVDATRTYYVSYHKGQVYYFCCSWCRAQFEHEPEHYLKNFQDPKDENDAH